MDYRVRVSYDRAIIAEAARRFALRSLRWDGFAAFGVLLVVLGYLLASGDRSWLVGVLAAIVVMAAVFGAALYVVPYRRSLVRFDRMSSTTADFAFFESGIGAQSALGQQELTWQAVDRVWTFPRVWLVFLGGSGYMTLPTAGLDDPTRAFILEQVRQHGGRIG